MTSFTKTYSVYEVVRETSVKVLVNKKNVRTSTRSKTLRMPRFEKMGLDGDLGALKVINLNADFWRVKMR